MFSGKMQKWHGVWNSYYQPEQKTELEKDKKEKKIQNSIVLAATPKVRLSSCLEDFPGEILYFKENFTLEKFFEAKG